MPTETATDLFHAARQLAATIRDDGLTDVAGPIDAATRGPAEAGALRELRQAIEDFLLDHSRTAAANRIADAHDLWVRIGRSLDERD